MAHANSATSRPTTLTLSWGGSSGATSYEHCYDTTNDNACNGAWVSTGTSKSAAISSLSQADIYQALFRAINSRLWITGFVSRGYYPPTILQDKSASIHGKPAADILWYWYPRLLGAVK